MSTLDWNDIGDRVREARLAMQLSQEQLAQKTDLDRTMISKIEAGTRRLDALELSRLARALDLPLGHFLNAPPAVMSHRTPLAEDTTTVATQASYRIDSTLASWIREIRLLISLNMLQPNPIRQYPGKVDGPLTAAAAARWLRTELNLGSSPIDSMAEFSERCGQYILVVDLPGDGASAVDGDIAAAVVSLNGDPGRRRSTAAHELGHLILGDEYSTDIAVSASRVERENMVDTFAAELLLPVEAIRHAVGGRDAPDRSMLVRLAAEYRTSWSLTLRQARAAEAITPSEEKKLRPCLPTFAEFRDSLGWAPQPDLDSIRVPPSLAHAVMTAYRLGHISSDRALELMHGQLRNSTDLPPRLEEDETP
ncbi:helix-turn-helix domain-containing protein [Nonomuraea endophytica]|uniref:Transcriptional regulator with XRE-family HTH domain n=1 Tax=Nonomuraea endophytica TaxID=714136 RepID=A0A7W7ZZ20_9ACTN|nr:XRE family transcriptional regulator [Nonomuraea endophytica]MBB5075483.1 transcriptional regulator with XRE-family HTH domain [Nonomuraea endophytica]